MLHLTSITVCRERELSSDEASLLMAFSTSVNSTSTSLPVVRCIKKATREENGRTVTFQAKHC